MSLNVQNTTLQISAGLLRQFPGTPLPQIAFSGRSNVGKSSLINMLLNRKSLARVSAAPGKTITINFYNIDRQLFFVDLPGYGFAKRAPQEKAQWSALTDGYFTKNPCLDRLSLVLQLIDSRVGPTEDDRTMLRYLAATGLPYAIVATKADKLNVIERRACEADLSSHADIASGTPILFTSTLKGEGKHELWKVISHFSGVRL